MNDKTITEFVQIKVPETTNEEMLLAKADIFVGFLRKQNGYMDAELVKSLEGDAWCFIFHFESFEKVKTIAEKMRNSREFDEFKSVIVPGSIAVTFFSPLRKW